MSKDILATYRLQLRSGFGFAAARRLVPYFSRLGVSHLYLSPVLRARSGSTHGYDVVNPTELNPELGNADELEQLVRELRRHEMGAILDIVPNHMATGSENPFWEDVLTHGRSSRFAAWFDIDWGPQASRRPRRVFLPVLGDRLGSVIDSGELRLIQREGRFRLEYYEQSFPIDPGTLPLLLEVGLAELNLRTGPPGQEATRELKRIVARLRALPPRNARKAGTGAERARIATETLDRLARLSAASPAVRDHVDSAVAAHSGDADGGRRLRRLVAAQAYRLAYWRRASREINYRRFFTISHLVTLRQEDPAVFAATHRLILDWVEAGLFDGLRIDHVDGLAHPGLYLRRLQAEASARSPGDRQGRFPLFVEKILARNEELPLDWPVAGTTGYDFLAEVEDIFFDPDGFRELEGIYQRFIRRISGFEDVARRGKRNVLDGGLVAEARRLGRMLESIDSDRGDGLDRGRLTEAVNETIVCLPVYRTYFAPDEGRHRPEDHRLLSHALREARARERALEGALDRVGDGLLLPRDGRWTEGAVAERTPFIQRFQQTCVSATAKGVEDTAFYVHVPLVSRNEVGGEPDAPLDEAVSILHRKNESRARRWPAAMLAASTHDTKRSADVRSRLDVLSEVPDLWERKVRQWHRWNRRHRRRIGWRYAPDRNTEYLLYQTLVAVWPVHEAMAGSPSPTVSEELVDRVRAFSVKAAREAKIHTSWVNRNREFEEALEGFVEGILAVDRNDRFLSDLQALSERVYRPGRLNALARTLIQVTAPGSPDIYQGDELWNDSLVDPDNRRPVDYDQRSRLLAEMAGSRGGPLETDSLEELLGSDPSGRLKLWVIHRALHLRRENPDLFRRGEYVPLLSAGSKAAHVFAFARCSQGDAAIVIAPRLSLSLNENSGEAPVGRAVWGDTALQLPSVLAARSWRCELSGASVEPDTEAGQLIVAEALGRLPVALLSSRS